jgi:hypothetical protein
MWEPFEKQLYTLVEKQQSATHAMSSTQNEMKTWRQDEDWLRKGLISGLQAWIRELKDQHRPFPEKGELDREIYQLNLFGYSILAHSNVVRYRMGTFWLQLLLFIKKLLPVLLILFFLFVCLPAFVLTLIALSSYLMEFISQIGEFIRRAIS